VSRTIVVVILLALLGGTWLARSWLDEQWDSLYETLEGWTGDGDTPRASHDDNSQNAWGFETPFERMERRGVETVQYHDSPGNRDFLKWEEAHFDQLNTLVENLVVVTLEVELGESPSLAEAADDLAAMAPPVRELLELVDTAPDSQLRTAAVTMYMQLLHALDLMERGIREGSPTLVTEAEAANEELKAMVAAYRGFAEDSIIFGS
jgi:hypothetical protein